MGICLFADFSLKIIGELHPTKTSHEAVSGQWLLNCSGHAFSKKETRFVANIFGCKISANKTHSFFVCQKFIV